MLLISQTKYLPIEIRFINCQKVVLYTNGDSYNGFGYYKDFNLTESNFTIDSSLVSQLLVSNVPYQFLLSSTEFLIESYLIGFQFFSTTTDPITINLYSNSMCSVGSCSSYFSKYLLFSATKIKTWTIYPDIGENQHMLPISFFVNFKSFFTIEIEKMTQIVSVKTNQYFYPDYQILGRKLIPILNQQFVFKALTSTFFYKSIVELKPTNDYDFKSRILLPGTEKNSNQKNNMSIEVDNLKILDQKLQFKIKIFSQQSVATVLIDYGDCNKEINNTKSNDSRSYFGLNLDFSQNNQNLSRFGNFSWNFDSDNKTENESYLVVNSEFKYDAWLQGFNIRAIKNGDILLKVIYFIILNKLKILFNGPLQTLKLHNCILYFYKKIFIIF